LIIEGFGAGGEFGDRVKDVVDDLLCRSRVASADDLFYPGAAKSIAFKVRRVADAITEEHQDIAGGDFNIQLVELRVVEWTQWQTGSLHDLGPASLTIDRARQSGVGDLQIAAATIPHRIDHRDVLRPDRPLIQ